MTDARTVYSISNGELVIADPMGRVRFAGKVAGAPVLAVEPLPDGSGCIAITDRMGSESLQRVDSHGHIVWSGRGANEALASDGTVAWNDRENMSWDRYYSCRLESGVLRAWVSGGIMNDVDLVTGRVTRSVFTK